MRRIAGISAGGQPAVELDEDERVAFEAYEALLDRGMGIHDAFIVAATEHPELSDEFWAWVTGDEFRSVAERGAEAITQLEAQPQLQPGEPGWWPVWGARAHNVKPGDIVMVKWFGEPSYTVETYFIAEKLDNEIVAPRFRSSDGKTFRIGALQRIVLWRRGNHNTLA